MKKNYPLSLILFLTVINISAQNPSFTWAKQFGVTGGSGTGRSMVVDLSGNVYTTGHFSGTGDFDPGPGTFTLFANSGQDIFVSKLDASGNFLWAKSLGSVGSNDMGYCIALDQSNNVYVTGTFRGTVDFDPSPGVFNLTSLSGSDDIFVCKLDLSGNFVWAKSWGSNSNDFGQSIAIDISGNVLTTGWFFTTVDFDPGAGVFNMTSLGQGDIFISKLNSSGNFVWAKQIGGITFDYGHSIATDNSGNVYTTGSFASSVDFDPGAGVFTLSSSAGSLDVFVSKLDASGNFVFAKAMGGNGSEDSYCISIDGSGSILTTGETSGGDFDPGAAVFTLPSYGLSDIFISKLDFAGNFLWAKSIGGTSNDHGYGITTDVLGNVYSTGDYRNTADFDPGAGTFNQTSSGASDIYVSKLDSLGNYIWAGKIGSAGSEIAYSITSDNTGRFYFNGSFQTSSDFDAGVGVSNMTPTGGQDVFTCKYAGCTLAPLAPGSISGSITLCQNATSIYSISNVPEAISYNWSLPGGWVGSSATNTIMATAGSTGVFSVAASNACGSSSQATLAVTVNPLPTISVNSGSICSGNSFTINPSGANTYTIQGGSAIVSPTTNTSFTVTGTSTAGCISASPAISNITVNPLPTISASTSTISLCVGQSATLTASGASTYTWNPGGLGNTIVISPPLNTTYTLTGTDLNTCQNSTVITQNVINCSSTGINQIANSASELNIYPNPFNAQLTVIVSEPKQAVIIFNSIGSVIYNIETKDGKTEIDLTGQPSGIYFIRIGPLTKKIIKQ